MEKLPSLFKRITWGMEGKHTATSKRSRTGCTAATSLSARSSMKIREAINTLAAATSRWKAA